MASQLRLVPNGSWHRRQLRDQRFTQCGQLIPGGYSTRDDALDGDLCPLCFTRQEITTGEMIRIERDALESLDYEVEDFDEDVTPTVTEEEIDD